jgi:hypothetical protein
MASSRWPDDGVVEVAAKLEWLFGAAVFPSRGGSRWSSAADRPSCPCSVISREIIHRNA